MRLADPGLTGWVLDEDNPAGLTYVVPRGDDVVVGGTAVEGATGLAARSRGRGRPCWSAPARWCPRCAARRCCRVRSACGRAGRPSGWTARCDGRPVISCYGHGGAGVTLSWGCAATSSRCPALVVAVAAVGDEETTPFQVASAPA